MKTFLLAAASATLVLSLVHADSGHARGLRGGAGIGGRGGGSRSLDEPAMFNGVRGKDKSPRTDKGKLFNKGKGKGIRGKGWGKAKGRGDNKLDFLQGKVDEKIETLECPADASASSTECDTVMFKPERLEVARANLTKEEWTAMMDEKKARMDGYVSELARCVKCEGVPLEDLLPDKEDILEQKCDGACPAPADLECTFPTKRSKAKQPGLTKEEGAALRDEREGRGGGDHDGFRTQLAQCVCCKEDFDLDAALAQRPTDKGPGRGGRPGNFGGKLGGKP